MDQNNETKKVKNTIKNIKDTTQIYAEYKGLYKICKKYQTTLV